MLRYPVLLFVIAATCFAQEASRFAEVVDAFSADEQFMGSVLVAKGSDVVYEKSVGWANAEWRIPNAADTKYRIGSLTKQFTAAAVLLLVEQGKLRLEDPLSKLLPTTPPAWGKVTVQQLLSHTGGVPSFTGFPGYQEWKLHPDDPAKTVARIADKPLEFTPGEKFNYSNTGYMLLGWIVAEVSGQTYEAFLRDHIFEPLGMKDSGYDSNTAMIERRASGYASGPKGLLNAPYIDMHVPGGAGALYSTTRDLLRWTEGLFGGKLLKPESLEKMTTPVKSGYGFGVGINTGDRKMIAHSGGIEGFSARLVYYPESKVTVAVLANMSSPVVGGLTTNLAAVVLGEPVKLPKRRAEMAVSRTTLEKYVGTYEISPAFSITVALEGDRLTGQGTGQPAFALYAESEKKFYLKAVAADVEFVTGADGRITHLLLNQGGRTQEGRRKSL